MRGKRAVEKIARAIEADAGEPLPDLRQALEEARAQVHRRGRREVTGPQSALATAPGGKCGQRPTSA